MSEANVSERSEAGGSPGPQQPLRALPPQLSKAAVMHATLEDGANFDARFVTAGYRALGQAAIKE